MSFFHNLLSTTLNLDPDTKDYVSYVTSQKGIVLNKEYLNSLIVHAKENNYINDIVFWQSPLFGNKNNAGFVSNLYDVIRPSTHSTSQSIGSSQSEILTDLNGNSYLYADSVDDKLVSDTDTVVMDNGDTFTIIVVYNGVDFGNTDSTSFFAKGDSTNDIGIVGYKPDSSNVEIVLKTLKVDSNNSGSVIISPTSTSNVNCLVKENQWNIIAFNNGVVRVNDVFYRPYNSTKIYNADLKNLILLNNSSFSEKKLHEVLIIKKELSSKVLDSLFAIRNQKLNLYTQNYSLEDSVISGIPTTQHAGIFGFKRLIPGYLGNAVRLRKDSNDEEQDFGFVNEDYLADLDKEAIDNWADGDDLYLVTMYDQGTNNGLSIPNFTNTDKDTQPRFYTTGGGGKGLLSYIQGNDSYLEKDTTFAINTVCHNFCGWHGLTQSIAQTIWTVGTSTSSLSMRILSNTGSVGNRLRFVKRSGANRYGNDTLSPTKTTHRMSNFIATTHVGYGGNIANTPASTDMLQSIDMENQSGNANSGDTNDFGTVAGKLRLLRGERLFSEVRQPMKEKFFFWIGLTGSLSIQQAKDIQQKLISIYAVDGE